MSNSNHPLFGAFAKQGACSVADFCHRAPLQTNSEKSIVPRSIHILNTSLQHPRDLDWDSRSWWFLDCYMLSAKHAALLHHRLNVHNPIYLFITYSNLHWPSLPLSGSTHFLHCCHILIARSHVAHFNLSIHPHLIIFGTCYLFVNMLFILVIPVQAGKKGHLSHVHYLCCWAVCSARRNCIYKPVVLTIL